MSSKPPQETPFAEEPLEPPRLEEDEPPRSAPPVPTSAPSRPHVRSVPLVADRPLGPPQDEVSEPGFRAANLYVERGPGAGQLIPVRQGGLSIGRASASDLRLLHPSISRHHAQLVRRGERFFIKDLGSQNGTFVNRSRVSAEVEVKPGDQITLGQAVLRLRITGGADEESSIVQLLRSRWTLARWAVFAGSLALGFALVAALQIYRLTATPAVVEVIPQVDPVPAAPVHMRPTSRPPKPTVRAQRIDVDLPSETAEASVPARPARPYRTGPQRPTPAKAEPPAPAKAEAVPPPSAPAKSPNVLAELTPTDTMGARYEGGDATGALELAKRSNDPSWTSLLTRFRRAYGDGQKLLTAHDVPGAKRAFQTALDLDQELAQGRGWYNAEIKRHLSGLSTLEGDRALARDQMTEARDAYRNAVALNPWNRQARTKLEALEGGESISTAPAKLQTPAKPDPRASAIEDAFEKD